MIKVIYKELPIDKISYLNREEFSSTGPEKEFYNFLKNPCVLRKTPHKQLRHSMN